MKKHTRKILSIFMVCFLLIGGCGQKAGVTEAPAVSGEETGSVSGKTDEGGKTLTVSVCWDFYYVEEAAREFETKNPGYTIKVTKFSNDYEKYRDQISTALMAGASDDLLDGTGIKFRDPATVKLLADFYPIMKADPEYNEDDYFTNAFKALEFQGGLYTFPGSVSFDLIAVNNLVSDELVGKFSEYDHVSEFDLIDIHKTVSGASKYYIHDSFDAITALEKVKDSFIDTESRTCDFNNRRLINLLTDAKSATEPGKQFGYTYSSNTYPPNEEKERSQKYLFQPITTDVYQYFLEFENELSFGNPIPYTNEGGRLIIAALKNFCISSQSKNKELAWEFIKSMTTEEQTEQEGFLFIPSVSVNKKLLKYKCEEIAPGYINSYEKEYGWRITGDAETQIEELFTKISALANMPMYYGDFDMYSIIHEPMEQFNNGNLSAEQAAAEFQNKVSLLLME